jgi:hypothetical protein
MARKPTGSCVVDTRRLTARGEKSDSHQAMPSGVRQLTALGFHAVRGALPRCADGTAAGPSISSTPRRSTSSAPISLTRQRHALFGSIERGNDAARELGESKILQAQGFECHD